MAGQWASCIVHQAVGYHAVGRNYFCEMLPATAKLEASDGAHVAKDRDDEGVGQFKWEADLLQHTDEDLTWEQITSLDEDYNFRCII